jgi:hypothetical protein
MIGRASRLMVLALAAIGGGLAISQTSPTIPVAPNERHVKPEVNVQDGNNRLWVLDFKFKDPRLIKVNIPGRGQRVVWYLWYQVINNTGQPRTFIPDFELVTHDTNVKEPYRDQILPAAQEAIAKIEDPTGFYKIKNSVTISADPIPASLPKAIAKPVTGVAMWIDPNEIGPDDDEATKAKKKKIDKLAESNHYSIFIAGLSNGWSVTDGAGPDKDPIVRRKTLQLNFQRKGDQFNMKSEEIRFKSSDWLYRGSRLNIKLPMMDDKKGKDKDKDKEKAKDAD